jgi:hypothetical protein
MPGELKALLSSRLIPGDNCKVNRDDNDENMVLIQGLAGCTIGATYRTRFVTTESHRASAFRVTRRSKVWVAGWQLTPAHTAGAGNPVVLDSNPSPATEPEP